jgi:hypothetical protein
VGTAQYMPGYLLNHSFVDVKITLNTIVPESRARNWCKKDTWDNFDTLHRSGKLKAPSPDDDVREFEALCFCSTRERVLGIVYCNGVANTPCCANESCCAREPGTSIAWPDDPGQVRNMYVQLWANEKALAREAGLCVNDRSGYEPLEAFLVQAPEKRLKVGLMMRLNLMSSRSMSPVTSLEMSLAMSPMKRLVVSPMKRLVVSPMKRPLLSPMPSRKMSLMNRSPLSPRPPFSNPFCYLGCSFVCHSNLPPIKKIPSDFSEQNSRSHSRSGFH